MLLGTEHIDLLSHSSTFWSGLTNLVGCQAGAIFRESLKQAYVKGSILDYFINKHSFTRLAGAKFPIALKRLHPLKLHCLRSDHAIDVLVQWPIANILIKTSNQKSSLYLPLNKVM